MQAVIKELNTPLFEGIAPDDRLGMLGCTGYHFGSFSKGDIVHFENENINHVGIVISGAVDMIKEDIWGNKTMLVRMKKEELFGETFSCGVEQSSVVSFCASSNTP